MKKVDKRKKHCNRHHLKNKCRGGQSVESNLLWIDIERHKAWHILFRNLNLDEVIDLLIRVRRLKDYQKLNKRI